MSTRVQNPERLLLLAVIRRAQLDAAGRGLRAAGCTSRAAQARLMREARAWLASAAARHLAELADVLVERVRGAADAEIRGD